jgi:hypothetical protein
MTITQAEYEAELHSLIVKGQETLLDMCQNEIDMSIENGMTLKVLKDLLAFGYNPSITGRAGRIIVNNLDQLTPLLEEGVEA